MNTLLEISDLNLDSTPFNPISFKILEGEIFGIKGKMEYRFTEILKSLKKSANENIKYTDELMIISPEIRFYEDLSVKENLEFFAEVNGYKENIDKILEIGNFTEYQDILLSELPETLKNLAKYLCILTFDFKLLIIEEFSLGLDDNSYEIARKILNNLKQMSKGILIFTSKSIDLEVCDEYIILNENGGHSNE
jgi:ABC-type multidrug transport system ATPase subunit